MERTPVVLCIIGGVASAIRVQPAKHMETTDCVIHGVFCVSADVAVLWIADRLPMVAWMTPPT